MSSVCICITNNGCLILHHKAFRADYNSRSAKIGAPSTVRILIQGKYTFMYLLYNTLHYLHMYLAYS